MIAALELVAEHEQGHVNGAVIHQCGYDGCRTKIKVPREVHERMERGEVFSREHFPGGIAQNNQPYCSHNCYMLATED